MSQSTGVRWTTREVEVSTAGVGDARHGRRRAHDGDVDRTGVTVSREVTASLWSDVDDPPRSTAGSGACPPSP